MKLFRNSQQAEKALKMLLFISGNANLAARLL